MNEKQHNNDIATAALRLSVIQPAFNGTFPDMNKQAYYARIAAKPLKLPDGRQVRYAPGTFTCWESAYRKGGFDALIPKQRADKGHSRRLDADVIAAVYELRERFPKLSAAGIREKMIADGLIGASDVSVSTFQRFIKKNNLKGAAAPGIKDRRAFEEEFATGMYQADTLHGPYLNENGRLRRTYCIMILDDKSRLITGGRFFYQDNSFNFQKVLKDAAATYGIPQKLYVDNGSPYKNVQLSLICGHLGCVLIHTPVRDGASKGKVERNFRTLRSRFLNALDPSRITGIDELNSLLADYIRRHNTSVHSATGMTPYTRYMEDLSQMQGRLLHLRDHPGIGLFTAAPGQGKTFALRCFSDSLNPNLVKFYYICLSTVTTSEFYRQLCVALGLEVSYKKSIMFQRIQDYFYSMSTNKNVHCMVCLDEAQYLSADILRDLKMLCNFCMDSKNCFSLILLGSLSW